MPVTKRITGKVKKILDNNRLIRYISRCRDEEKQMNAIKFSSPMTQDKWQELVSLKKSRHLKIELPNGYKLNYGQHINILKQDPKNFGQYVRIAYDRYYSDFE